jgi:hypothetical protein
MANFKIEHVHKLNNKFLFIFTACVPIRHRETGRPRLRHEPVQNNAAQVPHVLHIPEPLRRAQSGRQGSFI